MTTRPLPEDTEPVPRSGETPTRSTDQDVEVSIQALRLAGFPFDEDALREQLAGEFELLNQLGLAGELYTHPRLPAEVTMDSIFARLDSLGILGTVIDQWQPSRFHRAYSTKEVSRLDEADRKSQRGSKTHARLALFSAAAYLTGTDPLLHHVGHPFDDSRIKMYERGTRSQQDFIRGQMIDYEFRRQPYNAAALNPVGLSIISLQRVIKGEQLPLSGPQEFLYIPHLRRVGPADHPGWYPGVGAIKSDGKKLHFGLARDDSGRPAHGGSGLTIGNGIRQTGTQL